MWPLGFFLLVATAAPQPETTARAAAQAAR